MNRLTKSTPTIYDVASVAGVSPMTVSRALRTGGPQQRVHPETRARIEEIAVQLGYKLNHQARGLILRRTFNVGFYINHPKFSFYSLTLRIFLEAMQVQLAENGYQLGFYYFQPGLNPHFLKFLKPPTTCDALAFLGQNTSADEAEAIRTSGLRALSIYKQIDGIASVGIDEYRGGVQAADAMYAAGHRRVGCIWSLQGTQAKGAGSEGRVSGFLQRAAQLGMSIPPDALQMIHRTIGNPVKEVLAELGLRAFSELLSKKTKITALYLPSDYFAIPIVRRMDELGIRLGDDLSLISYDNLEAYGEMPWETPRLSAIRPPREEMGRLAADFLIGLRPEKKPQHFLLEPELILRESLKPPPSKQRRTRKE